MFEPCKSQLPLDSSRGPNLFMTPHLVCGNLLALVQLQHILYNPHKLSNFTWKPLWAVTPKWNLSGFVCRQVSVVLLPAGLSCRVSTSKHIPESQTLHVVKRMLGWSDFWAGLCVVFIILSLSLHLRCQLLFFTKSLGATVPPVAVVWLVLKSCQHEPAEGLWFKPNPNVLSTGSTRAGAVLLQHWRVRIQKSLPYHCCCCGHWAVQIKSRMGSPQLAPVALWSPPARGSKGLNN